MISQDSPKSDEWAVETGQQSRGAQPHLSKADTVGYFEPHQMAKLAENGRLYVVADAVGDAASGQMAAQYAVKRILRSFYTTDTPDLQTRLLEAIQQASQEIFDRNESHPQRRPLATYVTAALIHNNKLFVANVGDGRVYVVWDKDIELLTPLPEATATLPENSVVTENGQSPLPDNEADRPKEKVEADSESKGRQKTEPALRLLPEKAKPVNDKSTKQLSLPTSSPKATPLGLEGEVKIETVSRRLFAGDSVVMCSGGLTGYAADKEIAEAISLHPPSQAIDQLMNTAADRGNRGHLALSITKVLSTPAAAYSSMPMVMPTPPKWDDWETPNKTQSRPVSKPIPPISPTEANLATRPMAGSKHKSRPVEIPLNEPSGLPWRSCLLVGLILLMLCALPVGGASLLLTSDVLASVPVLSGVAETVRTQAAEWGINLSGEEPLSVEDGPSAAQPPAQTQAPPPPDAAAVAPAAGQGNSPLPTPTQIAEGATSAVTPTLIATPTPVLPVATPSPTLPPTIELPANCENKARFVTDVTVEDGTEFPPGRQFDKVWQIRNEGTCPWGPGYTVRFVNGDFFGVSRELPIIEVIGANENGDIGVPMISPDQPGSYRGVWQMYDLSGQAFGPTMFLEIEVVPGAAPPAGVGDSNGAAPADVAASDTLYDFIANAASASWLSEEGTFAVQQTPVSEALELPEGGGLVAVGVAELRGNTQSVGPALLTYPDPTAGFIEGIYALDVPLQPTDTFVAEVGFTRLSILSDDGVTFEAIFSPDDGAENLILLSETVQYRDSPISVNVPLSGIQAGQTGVFTLRVLSGDSTSRDWALWIEARLVRP